MWGQTSSSPIRLETGAISVASKDTARSQLKSRGWLIMLNQPLNSHSRFLQQRARQSEPGRVLLYGADVQPPWRRRWCQGGWRGLRWGTPRRREGRKVAWGRLIVGGIIGRNKIVQGRGRCPDIETRHRSQGGNKQCSTRRRRAGLLTALIDAITREV